MILLHRGLERARPLLLIEAERLENLARDLRAIAGGTSPSPADLHAAPVVDLWRWSSRSMRTVVGTLQGHPRLPDGPVHTTELWAVDLKRRWARTLSRYYVLGDPHVETDHGV
ncbi:DUF6634 family protein [Muricoccus nepalensis]|uniref:DUF6634 family protein n=1 Tax=Muricoccus nepalensis TaxID=1854500 RepID=UPI0038D0AF3C